MNAFLSSFALSVLLYGLSLFVFPKLGLLDFPERYGLARKRLPYPAGIIAVVVFLVWYMSSREIGLQEAGVMGAVTLLAVVSFIDDRSPLPSPLRLLVHLAAAFLVFWSGSRIYTLTSPLGGILKLDEVAFPLFGQSLPVWSGIFTVTWLLLTTNALNWFDGIPGQVNVIACIGFAMLGLLSLVRNNEPGVAVIAFTLAGIALAGACFDVPPARILIGDTGAMFFGFLLGLLGVYSGGKVATVFLALGLPIIDAVIVSLRRIARGQSPLRGGKDHLHHLLLRHGWSERSVIALTVVMGLAFGVTALFLSTAQKGIAIAVLILAVLLLNVSLRGNKVSEHKKGTTA